VLLRAAVLGFGRRVDVACKDMDQKSHPWEAIYRRDGRVFPEPFPRYAEVAQIFRSQSCRVILDLGCGSGRHVVHLAQNGFEAIGVDISPTALNLTDAWLREEGQRAGLALVDTRQPLPFHEGSLDAVLSTQVIHHALLEGVRVAISEIWRVLAPGGLAFVTVSGRRDKGVEFEEVEPGTFVPLSGPEAGLPHHIFSASELGIEFCRFEILDLSVRAEGAVLAVLARKA
jgi:SAM-dependent methyltransferase